MGINTKPWRRPAPQLSAWPTWGSPTWGATGYGRRPTTCLGYYRIKLPIRGAQGRRCASSAGWPPGRLAAHSRADRLLAKGELAGALL